MSKTVLPTFISDQVLKSRYFFLNLKPRPDARLTVVCGGREACDPTYRIDRASFPYYALEYVAHGEGTFHLGKAVHPLRTGSVFAYHPDLPHAIVSSRAKPLVKYFIDFAGQDAPALLRQADLAAGVPRQLVQFRWFHDLFDQLIETGNHGPVLAQPHCQLLLRTLISRLVIDARDARQVESPAYTTYTRCRRFAEENFLSLSTVTAWAHACALDQAYLSRLFNRFSDQKCYQFLQHLKIDHAADLLVRRGDSVKQAALAVGFDDPQHFSRVFKRIHGVSPTHFLSLTARKKVRHGS